MVTKTLEQGPCPVCGALGAKELFRQPAWSDVAFCSRECARTEMLVAAIELAIDRAIDRTIEGRNPN